MNKIIDNLGVHRGLAVEIILMFEELLDKHNILIPDDDRTGDPSEAAIYGCTYGELEDQIVSLLEEYIPEE